MADFGIAKFKDRTFMSTRNVQAGTPAYMAPEMVCVCGGWGAYICVGGWVEREHAQRANRPSVFALCDTRMCTPFAHGGYIPALLCGAARAGALAHARPPPAALPPSSSRAVFRRQGGREVRRLQLLGAVLGGAHRGGALAARAGEGGGGEEGGG